MYCVCGTSYFTKFPKFLFVFCVQLHTSEKSHHFPVNLQLKDKPDRFIDSPEMMTGLS